MERYGVTGGRTVMTPFPAGFKLKKAAEEDDVLEDEQRNEYQSLVGSVMYAAVHTRPDASFGVGSWPELCGGPLRSSSRWQSAWCATSDQRHLLVFSFQLAAS
ncbi:unnamed protein product [Closterium sp. NIES-54]